MFWILVALASAIFAGVDLHDVIKHPDLYFPCIMLTISIAVMLAGIKETFK